MPISHLKKNGAKIVTGNHRLVKNINRNVILNLVRTNGPISGASLAKITGMRPSTVQIILKNLEEKGLVLMTGTGDSTKLGGRRPTLWKICGNYGYVVGIQLEINEIQAVLVNMNSQIIDEYHATVKKFDSLSSIETKVVEIIENILTGKNIDKSRLLGVGVGVSGLVDILNGVIIKTSLLSSSQQPIHLEKSLQKYFNIPIYIENDANAAALAEKWFGRAKGVENIIFTLAVVDKDVFGIGFGLVLKNDIYRGTNMFAGETGLFDLNIEKILVQHCHYDKRDFPIGDKTVKIDELQLHHLIQALEFDNDTAKLFFQNVGKFIGNELQSVINLLDPSMVVIGGEVAKAKEYVLAPIEDIVRKKCILVENRTFQLVESSLSGNSVPLGAASIILQKIFQEPLLKSL
jgi:predicted NBD/HSP70 family sugar kinase